MPKKQFDFPQAIRSFVGHLEGTSKTANTIKNYRLDLASFEEFLKESGQLGRRALQDLDAKTLSRFHENLRASGQKANTRRRKLMTVQRFLRYLSSRKQVNVLAAHKVATPAKVERLPQEIPWRDLLEGVGRLPGDSLMQKRDRALLRVLIETCCLVSEVSALRWDDLAERGQIHLRGKSPRAVPVSPALSDELRILEAMRADSWDWVFLGYNKFGPIGQISDRGVELLVRDLGRRIGIGPLSPRLIRHAGAIQWLNEGTPWPQVRERLGLKSDSAYRAYSVLKNCSL